MPNTPKAGPQLKLAPHLSLVKDPTAEIVKGSAAADQAIEMPPKPKAVADDDELSALWDAIIPDLVKAKITSRIDWPMLEMMIRHFHAARLASDDLFVGEPTTWDEKNGRPMKNPSEVVFRSESMAFMAYAREAGMTFASRARIPGRQLINDEDDNPFLSGTEG